MQVKARGHQTILAHNPASRLDPIAVGVLHALDEHCTVHRQIKTVQRKQVGDPLQEFRFKRIVSLSLDWSSGHSRCEQGRIGFQVPEEGVVGEFLTSLDPEIFPSNTNITVRAAFDLNAAKCNPLGLRSATCSRYPGPCQC